MTSKNKYKDLVIHDCLKSLEQMEEDYKKTEAGKNDPKGFKLARRQSNGELNSLIRFPYELDKDGEFYFGHILIHLRKGNFWFEDMGNQFNFNSITGQQKYFDKETKTFPKWLQDIFDLIDKPKKYKVIVGNLTSGTIEDKEYAEALKMLLSREFNLEGKVVSV